MGRVRTYFHLGTLTTREREVFDLVREGLTNPQIAERLNMSLETVKHHVSQVLSKLGASSREEIVAWTGEPPTSRWSLALIALAAGGAAIIVTAVVGVGLLAWGVTQSGSGESSDFPALDGPIYYLPPNDGSPEIASADLLQQAGIKVVASGDDLFSLAPNDYIAVIIDKTRFAEVNHNWLMKQKLAGKVIGGARMNMDDFLRVLDATSSNKGEAWPIYGPDRNFVSTHSECGASSGESLFDLDAHPDSSVDFRGMLTAINFNAQSYDCASPSPAPVDNEPNTVLTTLWMDDNQSGWIAGTKGQCGRPNQSPDCVGVIYRTNDGGDSWAEQYSGQVQVTRIAFQDSETGFATGPTGQCQAETCPYSILRTRDGGLHWDEILPIEAQDVQIVTSADDAWVLSQSCAPDRAGAACGWDLRTTADGGDDWTVSPLVDGFALEVSRPTVDDAWAVISPEGPGTSAIIATHDAGQTWSEIPTPEGGAGFERRVFFLDASHSWILIGNQPSAGSESKEILATSDGGQTWTRLSGNLFAPSPDATPDNGIPQFGYAGPIVFTSETDGWFASPRGGLFHSADGGTTWSLALQDDNLQSLQFTDAQHGWVASLIALYRTTDGGVTWTSLNLPGQAVTD